MSDIDKLKGLKILIGREPGVQSRLLVSFNMGGQVRTAALGAVGHVPSSVSRCKAAEGVAHASLEVDAQGKLRITNLKPQENQVTCVNGVQVQSKIVSPTDQLTLGKDHFPVGVQAIITAAAKVLPQVVTPPKPVNISHLKDVWERYDNELTAIRKRQQELAKRSRLPIVLSSVGGALSAICGGMGLSGALFITIPIAIVGAILWVKVYTTKDTSIEDSKAAEKKLIEDYVCPNPDCKKYLNKINYLVLRQSKCCPYCKVPWVEN